MKHKIRWVFLSAMSGALAGAAATAFLWTLKFSTEYRESHQAIIWFLPLAGLFIGWIYFRYSGEAARGHALILDEVHNPRMVLPLRMAPFVFVGTILTHLFGGSAGREGTVVQMGATLADQVGRWFKVVERERPALLVAGVGAGFGAALGAPWAGVIFGMEMVSNGRIKPMAVLECLVASFMAYFVTMALHAPHTHFMQVQVHFEYQWVLAAAILGALCGLLGRLFVWTTHFVEHFQKKMFSYAPLRPLVGGLILIALYWWEGSYRYAGLGLSTVQQSLQGDIFNIADPLWKGLLTAITVGSGFKGGEFIPLVFMGSTLGSSLAMILKAPASFLGALGFAAMFGGASRTPIACSLMAMELFGFHIGPYALLCCFVSVAFSGKSSIYRHHNSPKTVSN